MKITLEKVCKRYGRREVVSDVSLDLDQGEIVGLLGPNGAGKTTTFYITVGLVQPNRGHVWLDNQDITSLPMHRRAGLGIQDNLLLIMEQTGVPRRLWQERLSQLLEEFRITHVARSLGLQVSGGERRRAEIARALAAGLYGPRFLLLDEPFAGVDPIAVADIQEVVGRLKHRGIGVLITDHNVRETLEITDRAYILNDGAILAKGNAADLAVDPLVRKYYLGEKFRL